ncbi:Amyloid-beta A4 precursor protein-binding family A member 2 [Merluccius polli]|uniref:Amyloid-beta A4 protein-binding family A member 2 n=1 Tax=Merluccius polli TaxID=89951 RepID=A0AA47NCI8_MERPO|nr:Amyloid-beta A4 precursor protein-binding family A member 2 [Merluccius polli]
MACKQPIMAHRKRLGTSGGSNMAAPAPSPALHSTESRDQKSLPSRPRPVRYPKESHGRKPLPRPSKVQYSPPKHREVSPSQPEQELEVGVVKPQYYSQPEQELEVGVVKPQYYSQPEQEVEVGEVKPQYYSQPDHEVEVGVVKPQYYSQPEHKVEVDGVEPQYYSQPEQEFEEGGVDPQYYSQPENVVEVSEVEAQYYSQPEQEVEEEGAELQYCGQPEQEVEEDGAELRKEELEVGVVEPQYRNQEEYRPLTPPTPEHELVHDLPMRELPVHELPVHNLPATFDGADDSLDDSSSDYMNNTSEDEEDYDEGLAEEDEGVTYYIRYCPEDDSYLEAPESSRNKPSLDQGNPPQTIPQDRPSTDPHSPEGVVEWAEDGEVEGEVREEEWAEDEEVEGEAEMREEWREEVGQAREERWGGREGRHRAAGGEEWGEGEVRCEVVEQDPDEQIYEGRPEPILDHHHHHRHHPPPLPLDMQGVEDEEPDYSPHCEEDEEEEDYHGDYYAPEEDNGNSLPPSPYTGRRATAVVEGEGPGPVGGDDAEEDIDLIVAEIKMSMSMGSLSSSTDHSPEEPGPAQYQAPPPPHRHDGRPKSLNLPPNHHGNPEIQRGFTAPQRSPAEEQQRWAQEQVNNRGEGPRRQQRSDLNVPLENNNVPETKKAAAFPSFVDGPCEPEDLIDGIIFAANYLGSTQLLSERNPSKNIRMMQAQEAVSRVKRVQKAAKIKKKASAEVDTQTMTEVDLFISTQRIKVLNADSQETMMDNALRTISYIADIGNIVVLMARRRMPRTASQDCIETTPGAPEAKKQYKMICHVFESEDAQLIAQSIGQAFSVAYQEFLRANGINPEDLSQKQYSDVINTQEMYNDDLIHFSNSENCKELQLEKSKGEILGVVIVESGWGSILPTVILANMMNAGPAARSGKLSIGDQIMSINNTSLVGLPLATCQGIIKGLKNQMQVKLNIVSCPPVTTVLIKRPDLKYQLGFSVQNGIICSLMRGGIAERGGVRVGHRIIEINSQSVVATAHEKIVQALSNSVGEIHMKTMPAAMFRLLTGQETPMYI